MGYTVGNVYVIAAVAVVGGALFGFDISSMSAIISTEPYLCYFNQGEIIDNKCNGPSSSVQGGITASMPAGSWLGSLISGFLSDIYGRKTSIQIGSVIWCIGSILVCASQNIPMLVVGRIINGLAVGICSAQVPVYITEVAPPSKRGRLVGCQQWAITWGILIMFYISYGSASLNGTAAFRLPWGLQMLPAIFLFFAMSFLPESPRWLAKKDRWEESIRVLALVHAHGDETSPFVAREMAEIREVVEFERANSDVTYWELLKPNMINRTHIGVFTQIWSQLTGMNVMMYYITYIFTMAGLSSSVLLPSSIQYIINVVMTVPALLFIDRWGRRKPLLIGAFFMMTFLFINAALLAVYSVKPAPHEFPSASESMKITGSPAKALIACTYLFVASYAPTWGPVSWIYPPELYPLRVRGKAVALATSANWAFNFALAYFVPPAFANITWKTYILFGVFCVAMFIHVLFVFPETAQKPLEEVEEIFDYTTPGSIKYLGTPAWKTHVDSHTRRMERGEMDPEEKFGRQASHDDDPEVAAAQPTEPKTT
ncbi:putative high-affinity glucose transporter [Coleophoma crateriformis]|uniref:Putative high-affinity glucose transporter n=1 Tax=Coleophoma crateriformis TaxID=565419 RepID=A0A3D8T8H1_9HELO|nr:putative high-affinity glucose transporter [Coleophoma crateriformis]